MLQHYFANKRHWPLIIFSGLAMFVFIGTTGQVLTSLHPGWYFVLWWILKTSVASSVLLVPLIIGYSQSTKKNWQSAIVILWLIGLLTFTWAHYTTQPVITTSQKSPELYVVQQVFITWLLSSLLLLFSDPLHQLLKRWSIIQRRHWLLIISGVFLIFNIINGYDPFGFHRGNSLIWFGYLFALGDWLANDRAWMRHWSNLQYATAIGLTMIVSWIITWLNMNQVIYSPHSGLTPDPHYLLAINAYQPLLLLPCLMILAWSNRHFSHNAVHDADLINGILILNTLGLPMAFTPILVNHFQWPLAGGLALCLTVIAEFLTFAIMQFSQRHHWYFAWQQVWTKVSRCSRHYWPLLITFVILWAMTLCSFALLWHGNWTMVQWIMTTRLKIVLVNVLIIFALAIILMAFINRWWIATGLTIIFYGGWLCASLLKIAARNEPILPTDLATLMAPGAMLGMVSPTIIISVLISVFLIMLVAYWAEKYHGQHCRFSIPGRIVTAVIALLYLASFSLANHSHSIIYKQLQNIDDIPYFYSQLRGAKMNGTLLQFANNVDVHTMNKPRGYSKQTMDQIAQRYQKIGQQINQSRQHSSVGKQNLVFVLSESYSDPARVPGLKIHGGDPIPYLHQLKKRTTSGLMLSSGYGGGTANMEYQALTGLSITNFSPTMPTPYSQLVPYQQRTFTINNLFPYSIGIHPFSASLYSRKAVYRQFGFNKFYHFDGGDKITYRSKIQHSPRVSDDSAYREVTLNLRRQPHGKFVQLATMQNHMPYEPSYYRHRQFKVSGQGFTSPAQQAQIETYIQGIHYTDQALQNWITQLDQLKQPVTVVWYGDHLPGIYHGLPMGKYGIALHETDYFIYSNKAAQKLNHGQIKHHHKLVSPNDFPALALEQMNVKVSPYYALLTKVATDIPATSLPTNGTAKNNAAHESGRDFISDNGKRVQLTKQQQNLFHDYQLVQYDLIAGHHYLFKDSFLKKPAK